MLRGQTILNNSLVNLDDLTYQSTNPGFTEVPTNANGLHTLMCVTDLVACCQTEGLGNWYYPDGSRVTGQGSPTFRTNRGQNEVLNNQQFYGSIRLWRYYTPPERGLFHCELPDANNVVQILYVNICEFLMIFYTYHCETNAYFPQYSLPASLVHIMSQWPSLPLVPLLLGRPTH